MDDFGDFFEAPPAVGVNQIKPSGAKQPVDLNSKILSSFDLSGSSHKAAFKFQQPSRHSGKRPQGSHFKPSASSADWKNINLENEFLTSVVPQQPIFSHQNKQMPGMPTPAQHQVLNVDLIGLAVDSSPSSTNPGISMPQTMYGYQHSVQNEPPTGNWQYGAHHSIATSGNQQFGTVPSAHVSNPRKHNISNNLVAHPTGMNSSGTVFGGSVVQSEGVLHPYNSQQPISLLTGQDMQSIHSTNTGHGQPNSSNLVPHPAGMNSSGTDLGGVISQSERGALHPNNSHQPVNLLITGQDMQSINSMNTSHRQHPPSASSGSSLPSWMTDPSQIPPLFKQVLNITATNNSFADTNLLYPIFLSSELPKDILGHIWTVANQSTPGKLTFTEVYTALTLIALAQKGEMDLSTRYVLKLQTAPIPKIQLPCDKSTGYDHARTDAIPKHKISNAPNKNIGSVNQLLEFGAMKSSQSSNSEAFADFQSFTASEPSTQSQIQPNYIKNDFDNRPLFQPSMSTQNPAVPRYPNRELINSPKHTSKVDNLSHDPPKQLLGSINFNKFNDNSSSKVLHSAAKKLSQRPVIPAPLMDDDFDDFKSAEPTPVAVATSSTNAVQANSKLTFMQLSTVNTDKYAALQMVEPVAQQSLGKELESSVPVNNSDKYAVFNDLVFSDNNENSGIDDFADFQSVESQQITVTQPLSLLNGGSALPRFNVMSQGPNTDDISSISSLELPSLSRTILNNSIGTTATGQSCNIVGLPNEGEWAHAPFPSVANVSGKGKDKSEGPANLTNIPTNADDGLYDLDEPISLSPIYERKKVIASHTKPESPKSDSGAVIRTKISNLSDSDFGDFSACPPPMEDDIDQHNAESGLEVGDSSLVDFDAFGHFEEEKMEVQKKKESAFKRTREDATAFSEFVKSSVVDLKPSHSHESSTTPSQQDTKQCTEEDLSVTENKYNQNDDSDSTLSFSTNANTEECGIITGWKLEPSCPEVQSITNLTIGTSEWEEEGNEMKARMEGSSNPMEIFTDHWSRCLSTCKDIIVSTGDIFASLNSPTVCHEVVNSNRGREFISCTSEVYGVSRRIRKGMETVGLDDEDLASSLKEIEIAWNNLLGFCPYTPSVHKTPEHRICANTEKSSSACSLCLLDTKSTEVSGLEYCGRFYHAPCANLWLNQIAPILPRLEAPST